MLYNVFFHFVGGGYKVARMPYEISTDLNAIGSPVNEVILQRNVLF